MYTGTLIHTLLCMNVQSGKGGGEKSFPHSYAIREWDQ